MERREYQEKDRKVYYERVEEFYHTNACLHTSRLPSEGTWNGIKQNLCSLYINGILDKDFCNYGGDNVDKNR